jgi:hypothetical protein
MCEGSNVGGGEARVVEGREVVGMGLGVITGMLGW